MTFRNINRLGFFLTAISPAALIIVLGTFFVPFSLTLTSLAITLGIGVIVGWGYVFRANAKECEKYEQERIRVSKSIVPVSDIQPSAMALFAGQSVSPNLSVGEPSAPTLKQPPVNQHETRSDPKKPRSQ